VINHDPEFFRTMQAKGAERGWQKHLWGRTVRAKALTLFYIMGRLFCAMPCRIKPETRLNAAHKIGILFVGDKKRVVGSKGGTT